MQGRQPWQNSVITRCRGFCRLKSRRISGLTVSLICIQVVPLKTWWSFIKQVIFFVQNEVSQNQMVAKQGSVNIIAYVAQVQ